MSDNTKELTADDFVNAYKATGLKPKQNVTLENGCACAFGALYSQRGFIGNADGILLQAGQEYGHRFCTGFVNGFDSNLVQIFDENYKRGYDLGQVVWNAVKEL